jgi:hypothetical protein
MQTVGIKSASDVKKLKTMTELPVAQLALLQEIRSGALTNAEWRPIQNELNALQKKWKKQVNEARTPADFEALKAIFGTDKR